MKWKKIFTLFLALSLFVGIWSGLHAQIKSRQKEAPLTLAQVLTGLQTQGTAPENRTLRARNLHIARRVRERGVTFAMNEVFESELRNAGASEELLKAIREKSPPPRPTPTPPAPKPNLTPTSKSPEPARVVLPKPYNENLNGVPLELIHVPAGTFTMGSNVNADEKPPHEVNVPSFYIGKYEVTQKQWNAVMGNNPSYFKGDDFPVEQVSWHDAQAFCKRLREMTGKAYRLPSEAEWEYACRAGTTGENAGNLDEMAWYDKNSGSKTHPVGQKQPNAFGLYDLHGNVWEWCEDVWHENYNGAPKDGSVWSDSGNSKLRVLRGGSWAYSVFNCRSADRLNYAPIARPNDLSFRVAVSINTPSVTANPPLFNKDDSKVAVGNRPDGNGSDAIYQATTNLRPTIL